MKRILVITAFCITFAPFVWATIPQTMSYQGILIGESGIVVPDGDYNLTFKFYNVPSGGIAVWTESQTVMVESGRFNVILGKSSPLTLPFDRTYYLGIAVGADSEMTPRIELTSTGYTFHAKTVEDRAITSSKIAQGTVVRSLNGLKENVNLIAGENVTITPVGGNLEISTNVLEPLARGGEVWTPLIKLGDETNTNITLVNVTDREVNVSIRLMGYFFREDFPPEGQPFRVRYKDQLDLYEVNVTLTPKASAIVYMNDRPTVAPTYIAAVVAVVKNEYIRVRLCTSLFESTWCADGI
jgi:hypothetical protein